MGAKPGNFEQYLVEGKPDWERIDFELPCSRCGYELRMLTMPRCPECGLEFTWAELLKALCEEPESLVFEFRWRKRPVRTWVRTIVRGLWPWSFWRGLSIHERIHVGPLVFLLVTAPLLLFVALHGVAGVLWALCWALADMMTGPPDGLVYRRDELKLIALVPYISPGSTLRMLWNVAVVVAATTTLLCSLRQTLGRCRVRTVQMLRVAAYSVGPICVVWGLMILLFVILLGLMPWIGNGMAAQLTLLVAAVLIPGIMLAAGIKRYLRLPRAWLVGPVAIAVALLFSLTVSNIMVRQFGC